MACAKDLNDTGQCALRHFVSVQRLGGHPDCFDGNHRNNSKSHLVQASVAAAGHRNLTDRSPLGFQRERYRLSDRQLDEGGQRLIVL
jgi:hypothetical protein